jgi:hypothetical protein
VIDFPNHSRSYDPTRRVVRFWGHDSAIEAAFFISQDALTRIQPGVRLDESGLLNAFDANRGKITVRLTRPMGMHIWFGLSSRSNSTTSAPPQSLTSQNKRREVCFRDDLAEIFQFSIVTYERRLGHWCAAITPYPHADAFIRGKTTSSFVTPDDSASESDAKSAAEKIIRKL